MADEPVEGVCEKCGGGVSLNEEGMVVCDGCRVASGVCTCEGAAGTVFSPPERPTPE